MTCSEDGTVRQFDLRQPSQFYTRPGVDPSRPSPSTRAYDEEENETNPPLISYRRHGIDLNTISCSTSQPHYLVVGGSHQYCFLHDRRMLGRDRMAEAGKMYSRVPITEPDEESLAGATKCVRRFAAKQSDRVKYNSHVTSCKISDANPNELLGSWSGDGVYLFDINRSPLPNEEGLGRDPWEPEESRSSGRSMREHDGNTRSHKRRRSRSPSESPDESVPGQSTRKISALVVELKKEIFGLASSNHLAEVGDLTPERRKSYDTTLALAHTLLQRINDSIEAMDQADIEFLQLLGPSSSLQIERSRRSTLAKHRRTIRAFVIGAGCVARANGGFVDGVGTFTTLLAPYSFRYRFLNAVVAFLNSGASGVREQANERFEDEGDLLDLGESALSPPSDQEKLEHFLEELERGAHLDAVQDVMTSEELFESEIAMVRGFKGLILIDSAESAMPRAATRKFWGERVARAILMKEAQGIDFDFVAKAFGEDTPERRRRRVRGSGETSALLGVEADDGHDEDEDSDDDHWFRGMGSHHRGPVEGHAPVWEHTKVYRGHCGSSFAS